MFVLFEEDGAFKTGTLLTDNDASLQVETVSGKRAKIKAANVLLRFEKPAASTLLDTAEPLAENVEAEFLWECASDGEFSFLDFARDYYGLDASPLEATAILLALHAAPIYFHRKGKGRFKKAPADILAAALAALEKKRQQAFAIEQGFLQALLGVVVSVKPGLFGALHIGQRHRGFTLLPGPRRTLDHQGLQPRKDGALPMLVIGFAVCLFDQSRHGLR